MPEDAGLVLADAYGDGLLREAPHRLHRLSDPEVVAGEVRARSGQMESFDR